jgi:hypothetical protein
MHGRWECEAGKSGLGFDHILSRLLGGVQRTRDGCGVGQSYWGDERCTQYLPPWRVIGTFLFLLIN